VGGEEVDDAGTGDLGAAAEIEVREARGGRDRG